MPRSLELWFDYASPFAYLATTQVERVAREHGAEVWWRPLLLGALFRAIGTPLVPIAEMSEPKRRYVRMDMERWAAHWGVPFRFPSGFPLRTVAPLRLTLVAPEEQRVPLVHRLMRLCWVEDGDPDDAVALRGCPRSVGLDDGLLEAISEPETKALLRSATDAAIERRIPGVPTFFVGDLAFWGQDRIPLVERALDGWRPPKG